MKRTAYLILFVVFLFSIFISCSSTKIVSSDRPGWVDKGSGFFTGEYGKAFYGVGVASNINNVSLRRRTADAQARVDLANSFQTRIEDLIKIYAKSVSGGVQNQISEEQLVQQSTRAFTEMDVVGAIIVDRYYDPVEGAQYSLVRMDVDMFKKEVEKMRELSAEVKKLIEENANAAFTELDERIIIKEKK